MSLLVFENIVKEYRNRLVLNGANLRVERGERVALVGPNGAGKTTLLRIAAGIECCDSGNVIVARNAKLGYLTQDLGEMSSDGRIFSETALHHEEISRLEQKMRELEKRLEDPGLAGTPEKYDSLLSEYSRIVNRFEGMDGYTVESKIRSMLLGLGLKKESLTIPVGDLSGGEKMRVALARILLEEPELLVLDEPTNHLDIVAVEWLDEFLKRFDGGVLVVSHDRYFLDRFATRVAELENGAITERSGNYSTFMEQKKRMREFVLKEQYRLRQEIKQANRTVKELESMKRINAAKSRAKMVQRLQENLDVKLEKVKKEHHLYRASAPAISFGGIKHVSAEIAKTENLEKSFGQSVLFTGVSFLIRGGEKVGIIGPNGCGKTTLINILLGRDREYTGFGRLGEWVRYGYLGQEVDFEDESLTILEELLGRREMTDDAAREYLAKFQFYGDEVDKKIEVLSGGERVRLYLACMMLEKPDCLILDEPTNHLDVPARDAVETAISDFKGSVIAISHDRYFLNRCVGRILEFSDEGLQSYEGNYEAYRQAKLMQNAVDIGEKIFKARSNSSNEKEKSINLKQGAGNGKSGLQDWTSDPQEVEARIVAAEAKIKVLEAAFGKDTPLETYTEYNNVQVELESLYKMYAACEIR